MDLGSANSVGGLRALWRGLVKTNTQLTVLFTLAALVLFGGVTIRHFVLTLFIGIISGSYSSIFNASPILVVWENNEVGKFFGRLFGRRTEATV